MNNVTISIDSVHFLKKYQGKAPYIFASNSSIAPATLAMSEALSVAFELHFKRLLVLSGIFYVFTAYL